MTHRPPTSSFQDSYAPHDVLEHISTPLLIINASQHAIYINSAAEMLFSTSNKKIVGRPIAEVLPHNQGLLKSIAQVAQSKDVVIEHGYELVLPDRKSCIVDYTISALVDTRPETFMLIELFQVEQHLRLVKEEFLHTQHQSINTLLRELTHEIKNPLAGLHGAAQLLSKKLTDPEMFKYTEVITNEVRRLENLIDRMLGPRTVFSPQRINIHKILEHVYRLIHSEAGDSVAMIKDYDPSIPDIHVDSDQLTQAFLNITKNALQIMQQQDGAILRFKTRTIRHFVIGQKSYKLAVRIDIIDNGPGIPEEIIDTLFLPLISKRKNGSGLGLSITKAIISRHNGLIKCASHAGATTFSIWLPITEPSHDH